MEPFPFPCHPDRSEAKRRDLRFRGPFDEMFFDGAKRPTHLSDDRGFYGAKSKDLGDAYGQMLFGAFRPQTTKETKKSQPPSEARDLQCAIRVPRIYRSTTTFLFSSPRLRSDRPAFQRPVLEMSPVI